MALIDGTNGNDVLTGTPDVDTINGLDGDDTINGGAGIDILNGGAGDDTFIYDLFTIGGDILDGGAGTDTIELHPSTQQIASNFGPASAYIFSINPQPMTSIERLRFASNAGDTIYGQFTSTQFAGAGIAEVVGGNGRDGLIIEVSNPATFSLAGVSFVNWTPAPLNAWEANGDFVSLVARGGPGSTLTAQAGLNVFQNLSGSSFGETLVGSDNADYLDGQGGADKLYGNGGNDSLAIINLNFAFGPPNNFTGAGSLYDGGDGTDVLTIGGHVNFLGTLQNIEGVNFVPAFFQPFVSLPPAALELNSTRIAMLPANAFFLGTGTVIVDGEDGMSFDGSQYTFGAGSDVSFQIYGGNGDGLSFLGTSNGDLIKFGAGIQSATGGGGADLFQVGQGTGTVTDFTLGEDQIDLTGSGLNNPERLADFLNQGPSGARIAGESGGVHFELSLPGVSAASLTASDFVFDPGGFPVFNFGTPLDDIEFGYQFNDLLFGGDGNDRIYTGGGRDQVFAGAGNDTVIVDGAIPFGFSPSVLDGGSDQDTLIIRPGALVFDPTFGLLISFTGSVLTGFETFKFESQSGPGRMLAIVTYAQASEISTLIGGAGSDSFAIFAIGSPTNTYTIPVLNLQNWSGNDIVVLTVGPVSNTATTLNSISHSGVYALSGGGGDDTFNGSGGIEVMIGGLGNDTFTSGGGADQIDGGQGTDTALFALAHTAYAVSAGPNGSVMIGGARYTSIESFRFADGKYLWDGTQLVRDNHPPIANPDTAAVNEDATATGNVLGNDSTGESDPSAPDVLSVTTIAGLAVSGSTVVHGQFGTLTIQANGSYSYTADADVLDALPAGKTLTESFSYGISDGQGGSAESTLTFNVSTVADLVTQTLGNGAANFTGTGADEVINGGRGDDTINGMAGSDRLYGGNGADRLSGGDGWDLLVGGSGNDRLSGDAGNDVLIGGKGADILSGGTGADVFDFGNLGTDQDTILDFQVGTDHIHLSDGVTITGYHQSGSTTVLDLSSGGSVLLVGVTGLSGTAGLLTPDLPDWTAGLPLL